MVNAVQPTVFWQMPRFLSLANGIFQTVVSVDMIEHIPASGRQLALNEMKRVTRRLIALHTPVERL